MFIRSPQLCFGSGSREKFDPKTLVALNSTWQRKAFSLSVIVYEAYNILQRRVRSSVMRSAFLVAMDTRCKTISFHLRLQVEESSFGYERNKMFSCKLDDP